MLIDNDNTVLDKSLRYCTMIRKHYEQLCKNDYKQLQDYYIDHKKTYQETFVRTLIDKVLVPKDSRLVIYNIAVDITYPVREDLFQKYLNEIFTNFDCEVIFPENLPY